jgi:hypothetical protein
MKKSLVKTLAHLFVLAQLFVTLMLCCAAARASTGKMQEEAKPVVLASPTAAQGQNGQLSPAASGVITGSVYQNDYFGLRLTIPAGWNIGGDAVKKKITEGGKTSIVPKNEQDKTQIEAAVDRTINLLTISKVPLGTPGQLNALFMTLAEPVPLSATGPIYIERLKSVLQQSTVPITFVNDQQVETINGVQFNTLTITIRAGENVVRQKYYVVIKKGYALGLITSIISDSDTEAMNGILKSVTVQ